ncbi:glycoside hydrolase family 43 protein [Flectobacillus rivi]|uniref:Glycoside hydrolase 43 family protein n=1 Tax=Flectobacillus rivi TaxID=2984209 RepID=A0ABT6YZ37_9BACT|nr:glycoside hydrolase 43 family protein [Flectobacillus rivi]MDI9874078.1 glycoside hydrolase 43 family protein [Flectobacillus rivi]
MDSFKNLLFKITLLGGLCFNDKALLAQKPFVSKAWVADNGDGTYKNPVLHADYSDPDAIRVGNYYYLVASSFENIPGLPILRSSDLVNWKIIGNALTVQTPKEVFDTPQHGKGVWAPAIRYYKGEFLIYYPGPDYGIYVIRSKNPAGPWSTPVLVEAGKGLIDPCPFWDEDGKAYLIHGFAGSRAGIKSFLVLKSLSADGSKVLDAGKIIIDGHETDPTLEGPKIYKRNGFYYVFAPAGGVATGWQLVFRSKNIYGPYERKVVMDQGKTAINGPHQGAWVSTPTGEDWFLHFQDKGVFGRVVHLQPMSFKHDWPVIGIDPDQDGKGEPVLTYKKPKSAIPSVIETPQDSDEFNTLDLGLQWQWNANPKVTWAFMYPSKGSLRLFTDKIPTGENLWWTPNVLLQKFPAPAFTVTTKLQFTPCERLINEKVGLTILGFSYANIALKSAKDGVWLTYTTCKDADNHKPEIETKIKLVDSKQAIYLRLAVKEDGSCKFSYSQDNQNFTEVGEAFQSEVGRWIGAKFGLFATREDTINDAGFADFDWIRVEK